MVFPSKAHISSFKLGLMFSVREERTLFLRTAKGQS